MSRNSAFAAVGVVIVASLGLLVALLVAKSASAAGGASSLTAGGGHSCAVTTSNELKCWGANANGQLGNGENVDEPLPVDALTCDPIPTVPSGAGKGCTALTHVDSVSTGFAHTCGRHPSGIGLCWGRNAFGQLGDGSTTNRDIAVLVCAPVAGTGAAGSASSCCPVTPVPTVPATLTLTPTPTATRTPTPTNVPTATPGPCGVLPDITQISAGMNHTCALMDGGTVWCWGENRYGQLGDGTTVSSPYPVQVCESLAAGVAGEVPCAPLVNVAAIDTGSHHNCALMNDDSVRCWGNNSTGQIGDGTLTDRPIPVPVCDKSGDAGASVSGGACDELSGAASVTAGGAHSCAVMLDGALLCWGENSSGQLGDSTSFDRTAPISTCAAMDAGTAIAGATECCVVTLTGATAGAQPCALANVVSASAGGEHTCAVVDDGAELLCWGDNSSSQLGHGGVIDTSLPVPVCEPAVVAGGSAICPPFSNVDMVSSGSEHTCALTGTGGVYCWGANTEGKLGDGTTTGHDLPMEVTGFRGKPTPTTTRTSTPTGTATQTPDGTPQATATPTASPTATQPVPVTDRPTATRTRTAVPLATSTPTRTMTPPPGQLVGDVDCDGRVTAVDAAFVLQLIAALIDNVPCPGNIDVNNDGSIDPVDVALILQYIAGFIPVL